MDRRCGCKSEGGRAAQLALGLQLEVRSRLLSNPAPAMRETLSNPVT